MNRLSEIEQLVAEYEETETERDEKNKKNLRKEFNDFILKRQEELISVLSEIGKPGLIENFDLEVQIELKRACIDVKDADLDWILPDYDDEDKYQIPDGIDKNGNLHLI